MNRGMTIASALLFALLLAVPASAHYSGVFEDFLVGVTDDTSSDRLREEIEKTRREIEALAPQLERLKQDYDVDQAAAVTKLQFYHSIGPDVYLKFILQSDNIVDVMANQKMVERQLENDLEQLNDVYLQYRQVKSATDTLMGHEALLTIIQKNLEGRTRFLEITKNFPLERIVDTALDVWNNKAVMGIQEYLRADSDYFIKNVQHLLGRESGTSPYRLEEAQIDRISSLNYLIRSDHVYVQYEHDDGTNTILIGTVSKNQEGSAILKFESGFVEGIMLSDNLISELPKGFEIQFARVDPKASGFTVELTNGAIILHPVLAK